MFIDASGSPFSIGPLTGIDHAQAPRGDAAPGSAFGPAYVRETGVSGQTGQPLYGPDAMLRSSASPLFDKEQMAEARMLNSLEERDRQVRRSEDSKGEALGNSNFIYQAGPDGKLYAIGTGAHTVRPEDESAQNAGTEKAVDGSALSEGDRELLDKLQARDAKVRAHEAAHVMAAGGQAVGLPTYTYQTGPDGERYAVGGSVNISILNTGDPEADARRAKNAHRAAMATGEPSSGDMRTASQAASLMARAQREAAARYAEQPAEFPGVGRII